MQQHERARVLGAPGMASRARFRIGSHQPVKVAMTGAARLVGQIRKEQSLSR